MSGGASKDGDEVPAAAPFRGWVKANYPVRRKLQAKARAMPYENMNIPEDRSAIMLALIAEMRVAATKAEFDRSSDELSKMVMACAFPRIPGPNVTFTEQGEMLVR